MAVGLRMIGLVLKLRRTAPRRFQRPAAFSHPVPTTRITTMSHRHADHPAHGGVGGHAHFDQIATVYDESLPSHVVEHYLRKRTAFVQALCPAGSAVVDVGCGTGTLAQRLSERGYLVTGVDPSAGMLEVMRARSPEIDGDRGPGGCAAVWTTTALTWP